LAVLSKVLLLASFIYRVKTALLKGQPIVPGDVLIFFPRARFLFAKIIRIPKYGACYSSKTK
jgi:hypothetical protein